VTRPRVLFASYHCYHDPTSGAAVCTRDLFAVLSARGWACSAFTGPHLDDRMAPPIAIALRDRPGTRVERGMAAGTRFAVYTQDGPGGFPVSVFATDPPVAAQVPSASDAAAFAALLAGRVADFRPDVVLTYGGDAASVAVRAVAKAAGAKVVFWLHNFGYKDKAAFAGCDAVVVPSEFSRNHYREKVGIECVVLPPVIDPNRVLTDRPDGGKFVTFVNPEPGKGVFWFARLAEVLGRTRPDIPFLVVEGRGRTDWLAKAGIDWTGITTIHRMANTPDPKAFYRLSRLVLVPSVAPESFGLVAAEAILNGIPVIASDRGALPEVVGESGECLPIPARVTPESRVPSSTEEVRPWVEVVQRLWDQPVNLIKLQPNINQVPHRHAVVSWEDLLYIQT